MLWRLNMSRRTRRTYSAEFKLDTVMEGLQGKKSVAQNCGEREIKDTLYNKWRDIFMDRSSSPTNPSVRKQFNHLCPVFRLI
jgi:transposase-like protein